MGDLKRSVVAVWIWCLVAKTPRPGLSGELISFSLRCQLVVKLSVLAVLGGLIAMRASVIAHKSFK